MPSQYSVADDESLTVQLVQAIADAADVDPVELTPPLYDAVDPEALEALFAPTERSGTRHGRVEFTYAEYRVSITVSDADASERAITITVADADDDGSNVELQDQRPDRSHEQPRSVLESQ